MHCTTLFLSFFFFNDTATTEIYTLSLHDALPIWRRYQGQPSLGGRQESNRAPPEECGLPAHPDRPHHRFFWHGGSGRAMDHRSEEHTSELQSRQYLVCRLLLEKKKTTSSINNFIL